MTAAQPNGSLNVLHVLRAPVGGLFRHVVDLARGQSARGHRVGLVADSSTGGAEGAAKLEALRGELALGISRIPMSRDIGAEDFSAVAHVGRRASEANAHVIHGHGAKGGAYARLARNGHALRVYTPHGGSLHYGWGSVAGCLYLAAERALRRRTDLFLFESNYGRDVFSAKIGAQPGPVEVVHNGVCDGDFEPITLADGATDLVFVGELRRLKGLDVLIRALARLDGDGRTLTATIAGDGPDRQTFETEIGALGLKSSVRFVGITPARTAFALGRFVVVPSRAESLPYIVLEAAAAGRPLIATNVGGIPEIFGPDADRLVPPGDPEALARALQAAIADPRSATAQARRLSARVRTLFSSEVMTDSVLSAYGKVLAAKRNG
jgi:glycosyltransferase involved in cell wall biosynthesis